MSQASSWGRSKTVVRHAPDTDRYHVPDDRMLDRVGGSPVGRFAVIPSSRPLADGRSLGFDANTAGVVHVDPQAPDGGVVFDPARLDGRQIAGAMATSEWPHEVYYKLGTAGGAYPADPDPGERGPAPERRNDRLPPGSYVAPAARPDGAQRVAVLDETRQGPRSPYESGRDDPLYATQEQQRMRPIPPLAPPPDVPRPAAPPRVRAQPQPAYQAAPGYEPGYGPPYGHQPYQTPPQAAYGPPYAAPAPPPGWQPPPPPPTAYAAPASDPALLQMMAQMSAGLEALGRRLDAPPAEPRPERRPPRPSSPLATLPVEAGTEGAAPPEYPDRYRRPRGIGREGAADEADVRTRAEPPSRPKAADPDPSRARQVDRLDVAALLEIPFLTAEGAPRAAECQVFFEYPDGTRQAAFYHAVCHGTNALALVYDVRWKGGVQHLPPDLGADVEVRVHVPAKKKTFCVVSINLAVPLFVFDLVVLPVHDVLPLDDREG